MAKVLGVMAVIVLVMGLIAWLAGVGILVALLSVISICFAVFACKQVGFKNKAFAWGLVLLAASGPILYVGFPWITARSDVVTITDATVKRYGGADKYLVYTNHGTYENTDCWSWLKFNSSDLHGKLLEFSKSGKRARIYYYGWRFQFKSIYPNIYKVEPVE